MEDRTKSSLLWGLAGGFLFLVLAQTVRLVSEMALGLPKLIPVAGGVFVAAAGIAYFLDGRLARKRQV
jgi:phosphatidylglycerophosphate synthase